MHMYSISMSMCYILSVYHVLFCYCSFTWLSIRLSIVVFTTQPLKISTAFRLYAFTSASRRQCLLYSSPSFTEQGGHHLQW